MCPPKHFTVRYRINPWMRPDQPVSTTRAGRQWASLRHALLGRGHAVRVVEPQPGLPDMVFAANGGIVIGDRALIPRFRHNERSGESRYFADALRELGLAEVCQAEHVNEGEGDFRLVGSQILAGSGFRSEPCAADEVADYFELPVLPLRLVNPRLYHLDTALAVLDDRTVTYWPGGFSRTSRGLLRDLFPDAILAGPAEAAALGLNLISDGSTVFMSDECDALAARLAERGFNIVRLSTSELRKAGGGAKCCVLERHAAPHGSEERTTAVPALARAATQPCPGPGRVDIGPDRNGGYRLELSGRFAGRASAKLIDGAFALLADAHDPIHLNCAGIEKLDADAVDAIARLVARLEPRVPVLLDAMSPELACGLRREAWLNGDPGMGARWRSAFVQGG